MLLIIITKHTLFVKVFRHKIGGFFGLPQNNRFPQPNRCGFFLAENTKDWLIVLIADVDEEQARIMKKQIAYHLRIKTVEIRLPQADVLYGYLEKKCKAYGIQIDEEAGKILKDTIHALKDSSHFEGYNTLNLMAQEMIYELYSQRRLVSKVITGEMLSAYGADGDYTKNYMETVSKKQKIGFSYEKQEGAEE